MRFTRLFFPILILSFLWLNSCKEEIVSPSPDPNALTVLNIGDSRVAGRRPLHESYRYELWKNFVADDWAVDFTGPFVDEGSYPAFMGKSFDVDHGSVGGWKTTDVLRELDEILEASPVTAVVLMDIAGNDLLEGSSPQATIDNINTIIDRIQAAHPNVTILIEQIAPAMTSFMTPELTQKFNEFNALIPNVASQQTAGSSKVFAVDMATGFGDQYLADELHYNEAGAKFIADRYYQRIVANVSR